MNDSRASLPGCSARHVPLALAIAAALGLLCSEAASATGTVIATSNGASTLDPAQGSALVDSMLTVATAEPIDTAKVSIRHGWQASDALSCDSPADTLTCDYDPNTGVLSVTGTASAAEWEATLRSVRLTTLAADGDSRGVSFTLGSAIPFRGPGHNADHYYEFVPVCDGGEGGCGVTWTEARELASQRTLFGMAGYLATITSPEENAFLVERIAEDGWIGASDDYREINAAAATGYTVQAEAEGNWYWVTGPEAGTLISTGNVDDGGPLAAAYANWADGEPNNYPLPGGDLPEGEYYGQLYASDGGRWNDLGAFSRLGYIVEYGETAGDPVPALSATKSIEVRAARPVHRASGGGSAIDPPLVVWLLLAGAARFRRSRS